MWHSSGRVGASDMTVCLLQANISAAQTPLIVNTSSPVLAQTTTSVTLPSAASRILVQFNSLADTSNITQIPSDVQSLDAVVNSTYLPNVDTHVINLDNSTANASTLVTELRSRDGKLFLLHCHVALMQACINSHFRWCLLRQLCA